MRKSKLIEILNSIEGNPEIKLWNGFVQDWVDIDPTPIKTELMRRSRDYWLESCRLQDCVDKKNWEYQMPQEEIENLKKNYSRVCKWEINSYIGNDPIKKQDFQSKSVYILQANVKGEKTFDRMGDIRY